MNRRTLLAACPLALLVGCGNSVTIPVDVRSIVDAVADYLLKYAPPSFAGQIQNLRDQLAKGGDWKATARAFVGVANSVLDLQVVPDPYAAYARTALAGLSIFLGAAGAGGRQVSMAEAVEAAGKLR